MDIRKIHPTTFSWLAAATVIAGLTAIAPVRGQGAYPAARTGGNYMHNYYFPPAPSSTPWAPAWSPDGKSIAVAMSGSIWNVDPATGVAHELTYGPKYHSSPDWSPDGRWIVYTADDSGKTIQLEILNVADRRVTAAHDRRRPSTPIRCSRPTARRVAYVSTKPNGYFNVYIRPIKDGQWAGDEIAVTKDNLFPQRPTVLRLQRTCTSRPRGCPTARSCCSSPTADVAARVGQRAARAGVGRRHGTGAAGARGADALSRRGRTSRSTASASSIRRRAARPISSTTSTCSRRSAASRTS